MDDAVRPMTAGGGRYRGCTTQRGKRSSAAVPGGVLASKAGGEKTAETLSTSRPRRALRCDCPSARRLSGRDGRGTAAATAAPQKPGGPEYRGFESQYTLDSGLPRVRGEGGVQRGAGWRRNRGYARHQIGLAVLIFGCMAHLALWRGSHLGVWRGGGESADAGVPQNGVPLYG